MHTSCVHALHPLGPYARAMRPDEWWAALSGPHQHGAGLAVQCDAAARALSSLDGCLEGRPVRRPSAAPPAVVGSCTAAGDPGDPRTQRLQRPWRLEQAARARPADDGCWAHGAAPAGAAASGCGACRFDGATACCCCCCCRRAGVGAPPPRLIPAAARHRTAASPMGKSGPPPIGSRGAPRNGNAACMP
jgi:hypothetical protein